MLAIGLQGSPRKNGSTNYLLEHFMEELEAQGATTTIIDVPRRDIRPCRGCGFCEKKGFCVIDDDDMSKEIFGLLREAEIVVAASPVFFYSVTAQLKALIDRSQALWSRKYRFRFADHRRIASSAQRDRPGTAPHRSPANSGPSPQRTGPHLR